jgi:hypothetical protein
MQKRHKNQFAEIVPISFELLPVKNFKEIEKTTGQKAD